MSTKKKITTVAMAAAALFSAAPLSWLQPEFT